MNASLNSYNRIHHGSEALHLSDSQMGAALVSYRQDYLGGVALVVDFLTVSQLCIRCSY